MQGFCSLNHMPSMTELWRLAMLIRDMAAKQRWDDVACSGMQPAVQYMAGELRVDAGEVLPVLATHNTVRLRFDLEEAEYLHLATPDAAFPANNFSMLADSSRNQVLTALAAFPPPTLLLSLFTDQPPSSGL